MVGIPRTTKSSHIRQLVVFLLFSRDFIVRPPLPAPKKGWPGLVGPQPSWELMQSLRNKTEIICIVRLGSFVLCIPFVGGNSRWQTQCHNPPYFSSKISIFFFFFGEIPWIFSHSPPPSNTSCGYMIYWGVEVFLMRRLKFSIFKIFMWFI